jgi:prepilin-type N-terminal cleavage/methylation domain-containing protein
VLRTKNAAGFTLTEMIVVVLLVGILAAFAVPQYMKSLENSKAEDGAALMNMVGTTNRMYALDHSGTYTAGNVATSCTLSTVACPAAGGLTDPCNLVSCKYLAAQDFDKKAYSVNSFDPGTAGACLGLGSGRYTACAKRRSGASPGTSNATYQAWGYTVDINGSMTAYGGAPTPVQ